MVEISSPGVPCPSRGVSPAAPSTAVAASVDGVFGAVAKGGKIAVIFFRRVLQMNAIRRGGSRGEKRRGKDKGRGEGITEVCRALFTAY